MTKIVVFSGSARAGSFNASLASAAETALQELGCEIVRLGPLELDLPMYNADLEAKQKIPENAITIGRHLSQADGAFIASPEYNASVSPLLKNAIDWVSRIKNYPEYGISPFDNTVFCLGAASPGGMGGLRGLNHLRDIMVALGATVISQQVSITSAHQAFDENGAVKDERAASFMQSAMKSLAEKAAALGKEES